MKAFTLAFFLACASAHAENLIPEPCSTGLTAFCNTPAQDITLLTYSPNYGRVLVYMTDGTVYDSGLYAASTYGLTGMPVYSPNRPVKYVTLDFTSYVTTVRSGRSTARVTHWQLVSGSVN